MMGYTQKRTCSMVITLSEFIAYLVRFGNKQKMENGSKVISVIIFMHSRTPVSIECRQ